MLMPVSVRRKIVTLFLSLWAGALSAGGAEIQFQSQVDVSGSIVLLGDIAEIQAAEPAERESLRRIELFPSPGVGQSRMVRATEVRQLLQLHGVASPGSRFSGPGMIRITGRGTPLPSTTAKNERHAPQDVIAYAKRPIAQGDTVRAMDVELKVADQPFQGGQQPARDVAEIVGYEARRPFAAGQPIDVRFLRKPVLVTRGQAVSVVARSPGVRARTTARALENGSHGDLVLLESIETKQRYAAIVTGAQQAEVLAAGVTIADPGSRVAGNPPPGDKRSRARASASLTDQDNAGP